LAVRTSRARLRSRRMDVRAPAEGAGSGSPGAISVAIVDGDPLARRALRSRLDLADGIEVLGEAPDASGALDLLSERRPDLALIDSTLPDRRCTEAIGALLAASPRTRILVLGGEVDQDIQIDALQAGAAGWLPKSIDLEVLPRVVRGVRAGEAAIPRALGARLLEMIRHANPDLSGLRPVRSSLTQREWEVVDLLVEGAATAEIAERLRVSPTTVRTHVKHILRKLGAHSRDEAIRRIELLRRRPGG
jgi:two-component system, NarL family, response regulator LiaR